MKSLNQQSLIKIVPIRTRIGTFYTTNLDKNHLKQVTATILSSLERIPIKENISGIKGQHKKDYKTELITSWNRNLSRNRVMLNI